MGLPFFSKKENSKENSFLPKLDINDIRRVAKSSGRSKKDVLEEELISELNKDLKEIRESTLENPKDESYDQVGRIENPDKTPIKNLSELIEFVKTLPESEFKKFVNPKFNLFSEFAQDKLGQIALSVELALLTNKQDIISKLQAFLISEGNLKVIEKSNDNSREDKAKRDKDSIGYQKKIVKESARKILMKTPNDKVFVFGKIKINSLEQLYKTMNSLSLRNVVREIENKRIELAKWIETGVGDSELANRILNNYEPRNVIDAIDERIRFLKKVVGEDNKTEFGEDSEDINEEKTKDAESIEPDQEQIPSLMISSTEISDVPQLISFISALSEEDFESKIKPIKKDITAWIVNISGEEDLSTLVFSNNKSDFLEKIESARYSVKNINKKKGKKAKIPVKTKTNLDAPEKSATSEKQTKTTDFDKNSEEQDKEDLRKYSNEHAVSEEDEKKAEKDKINSEELKDLSVVSNEKKDVKNEESNENADKEKDTEKNSDKGEVGFFDDAMEKKVKELESEIENKDIKKDVPIGISDEFEKDFNLKVKGKVLSDLPAPTMPDEIKQPKNEYLANLVKTSGEEKALDYSQKSDVIKDRNDLIDKKTKLKNETLDDLPTEFLDNEKADYIAQVEDKKKIEDKIDLLYSEQLSSSKPKREELLLPEKPNEDFIDSLEKKDIEIAKTQIDDLKNPFEAKEINKYFKEYANAAKEAISLNVKEMESAIELKKEEIKLLNETIDSKKFMIETEIKEQVKSFNALKEKLTDEINSLVKEKDELNSQINSLKERLTGNKPLENEEMHELKNEILKLNEKIKDQESIIYSYNVKGNEGNSINSLNSIDNSLVKASADNESLIQKNLRLEEENKNLRELNEKLEKGLSPKEKAVINFSELKSELATTKKEVNVRKNELNRIEKDIELRRNELNILLLDIENVKNLKTVKSQLKSESTKLETLKKEVESKEIELNNSKKLLDSVNEDYKAILATKEKQVAQVDSQTMQQGKENLAPTLDFATQEAKIAKNLQPQGFGIMENLSNDINSNVDKSFDELLDGISGEKAEERPGSNEEFDADFGIEETSEEVEEARNVSSDEELDFDSELSIPDFDAKKSKIFNKKKPNSKKLSEEKNILIDNFVPEFDKELSEIEDTKIDEVSKKSSKSKKAIKDKKETKDIEVSKKETDEIEAKSKKLLEELEKEALANQKEAQSIENKGGEIINKESFGKKPKPVDTYIKTIDTIEDVYDAIREARNMADIRKFDEAHERIQEIENAVSKIKLASTDKKRIEVEVRLLKLEVEIA